MSAFLAIAFASLAYLLIRFLHLTAYSCAPLLFVKDQSSQFVQSVLDLCPTLQQPYIPPLLWGRSGHVQTIAYAKMGRVSTIIPSGVRHSKVMPDGSTLTFDIYEPHNPHKSGGSYCILFCPGIGSSSESAYIRTMVDGAQNSGFISVVVNHLGALKNLHLTSPRMFTYGGTEELKLVREEVDRIHPGCGLILVGCSMGGNIVLKYLGENPDHQRGVLAAVSVCTGYNVVKAIPLLLSWENFARGYMYIITANQKRIMRSHRKELFTSEVKKAYNIDEEKIFSSKLLMDLDEAYARRLYGFDTVEEYYDYCTCSHNLNTVKIPLLLVNAEDDPLVPTPLLDIPRQAASQLPHCIFVQTKHGGHLGYFENGLLYPDHVTWIDRLIVEYADAVRVMHQDGTLPIPGQTPMDKGDTSTKVEDARQAPAQSNGDMTTTTTTSTTAATPTPTATHVTNGLVAVGTQGVDEWLTDLPSQRARKHMSVIGSNLDAQISH